MSMTLSDLRNLKVGFHTVEENLKVYKSVLWRRDDDKVDNYGIATLEIPIGADIVRPYSYSLNILRADRAIVKSIAPYGNNVVFYKSSNRFFSSYDNTFTYKEGDTVVPNKPFSYEVRKVGASGIYFFLSYEEVEDYIHRLYNN